MAPLVPADPLVLPVWPEHLVKMVIMEPQEHLVLKVPQDHLVSPELRDLSEPLVSPAESLDQLAPLDQPDVMVLPVPPELKD